MGLRMLRPVPAPSLPTVPGLKGSQAGAAAGFAAGPWDCRTLELPAFSQPHGGLRSDNAFSVFTAS